VSACSNTTNHNIKGKNLFTALTSKGMSWRVYSESKNPGADWRKDGTADTTIVAPDYLYTADEPVGAIGTPGLRARLARCTPPSIMAAYSSRTCVARRSFWRITAPWAAASGTRP
jgi:hypothetical protein